MSVRSVKTAVIWAKPLRENDQVRSSPGVPASATSIGNVTCFSISSGESAGAKALTWTWTLVMSGTASIGRTVSAQPPVIAAAMVNSSTYQRPRTEKARMRAIIVRSVLGQRLQELGLEREGVGDRDGFAGGEAGEDLADAVVAVAEAHHAFLEAVRGAHEHHLAFADRLHGAGRHRERRGVF